MKEKIINIQKTIKKKMILFFSYFKFNKKEKKINKYKKLKKLKKKNTKEIKRNKYNIQLNIKFKTKQTKNIIIFSIVFILTIILIITKGSYFKIKNINVISPDGISNTYILEKKLSFLKNKLIFKINKKEIQNIISETEQNINKININIDYPNSLNIKVDSSPIIFKTNLKGKNYLITQNGTLIPTRSKKIDIIEIEIKNFEIENYPDYKRILNQNNLNKILFIKKQLTENIVNIEIKKLIYYKKEKEIHIIINNNTRLIFDLFGNIKNEINELLVFNKEKIDITKSNFIYIDNRIKSKILYCPIEEIKKCIKNINFIYGENLKTLEYKTKNIKK